MFKQQNIVKEHGRAPAWLGPNHIAAMPVTEAIHVLEDTLLSGFDPEDDGVRNRMDTLYGQLLQMPSATSQWCGTKLITLRESEDLGDVPAVQGIYVLFEGASLSPVAVLEGAGLTALRTPAMTALAIKYLAAEKSGHVAIFGTGVQARAHVEALMAVYCPASIAIVGRSLERATQLVDDIRSRGVESYLSGPEIASKVDLLLCCTASAKPLFDGALLQEHAMVAAVGAHDPNSREVDSTLVQRSSVVVESHRSARREAGDLIIPHETGEFEWNRAIPIREVILNEQPIDFRYPRLFKGTGMPWQDLAVAARLYTCTSALA